MFRNIRAETFFYTGIAVFPAFLFTKDLFFLILSLFLIIILNLATGKKFRLLPNILLSAGIIAANLYPPGGKILFSNDFIIITEEALITGLRKTVFLIGTVYISRFAVRKELSFPGKSGELLFRSFYYFEKFTETANFKLNKISLNSFIDIIDKNLITMQNKHSPVNSKDRINAFFIDKLFFVAVTAVFWGINIFSKFNLRW